MIVQRKQDVIKVLQTHKDKFNKFGVNRLGLFGSFARNEANNESDIDILVVFEASQKNFNNFMNLSFFLEDVLGRKVDLVTIDSLSPHIGKNKDTKAAQQHYYQKGRFYLALAHLLGLLP